jgi:hypothetical protein
MREFNVHAPGNDFTLRDTSNTQQRIKHQVLEMLSYAQLLFSILLHKVFSSQQ